MEQKLKAKLTDDIYITEQATPLYSRLQKKYSGLCGSEYLDGSVPFGEKDPITGLRNESITNLTFDSGSFDFILSFDVFEHGPSPRDGLKGLGRRMVHFRPPLKRIR